MRMIRVASVSAGAARNIAHRLMSKNRVATKGLQYYIGGKTFGTHLSYRCLQTSAATMGKIVPFNLADIGEAIAEVEVMEWYVEEGDIVEQFDRICLVESDKASVPITSRYDGKIVKLHYEEGDMAKTGLPLVDIEVDDADLEDIVPKEEPEVSKDHLPESTTTTTSSGSDDVSKSNEKFLMTPAVRRVVKEHNVDLSLVTPTGKDNRILKEDVLNYLSGETAPVKPPAARAAQTPVPTAPPPVKETTPAAHTPPPLKKVEPLVDDQVHPIRGYQKAMAKSMVAANAIPHFGYYDECILDGLVTTRAMMKDAAAKRGIRLSYMPFIMKAASLALTEYPILNSHVNDDCTEMTYKSSHNIALAMQTPQGLLVPNVKNCEQRSIFEIAQELNRLQDLGAAGLLGPDDLSDGTFSISNIGVVGGTYASPVLVVPQVAIGALGAIRKLPRFDENDNVVAQHVMAVSWSADHRVIDGVTMAEFSNLWKSYLANPAAMLGDLR